jgi:hypothetical protein
MVVDARVRARRVSASPGQIGGRRVSPRRLRRPPMPERAAECIVVYWPALAPGLAQVQVAQFIASQGSDDVLVIVGQRRQRWARAQVERVLAAFRQAGYTLEACVDQGVLQSTDAAGEEHTTGGPPWFPSSGGS